MLVAISVAFGWILWPFSERDTVGGIAFAHLRSLVSGISEVDAAKQRNVASSVTVVLIAILVVIPLTLVVSALVREVSGLVERFQSGELELTGITV